MHYKDRFNIDKEKEKDERPTTIVIPCTFGEKYRLIKSASQNDSKLVNWALNVLLAESNEPN